jgi:hypothetical protein
LAPWWTHTPIIITVSPLSFDLSSLTSPAPADLHPSFTLPTDQARSL